MTPRLPWRRVEVIWNDAATKTGSWIGHDEVPKPERVNTSGWLIRDCPDYVAITFSVDDNGDVCADTGPSVTIPRGMILSISELRVVRPRKKKPNVSNT